METKTAEKHAVGQSELNGGLGALTFADAISIARGCTDYGGGYRSDAEQFEIYQHGIQTVINALTRAAKGGLNNMQVRVLHRMGSNTI